MFFAAFPAGKKTRSGFGYGSFVRGISAIMLALAVAGCSTGEDYFANVNPFAKKEVPLPGERRSIETPDTSLQAPASSARPLTVSAPNALNEWLNPGGTANNSAGNIALTGQQSGGWRITGTSSGNKAGAAPLVVGGRVVLFERRKVSAYAASTGASLWSADVAPAGLEGENAGGGIASDGARIYVATSLRVLSALDASTGAAVWTQTLPEPARSAPTIANGRLYVVSAGNAVYAFSTQNGQEIWRFSSVPEAGGLSVSSSPAVSGNMVVVPFSSGELVGLDAAQGTQKWSGSLTKAARTQGVMSLSDIAGRPVIDKGVVFAGSVAGRMVAIKEASGEKIWEKNLSTAHAPAVSGDGVFIVTLSGEAYGLERGTGGVRWVLKLPVEGSGRTLWAGPLLAGNALWFASNRGKLVSVDPRTGQLMAQRELGEGATLSPFAASGRLYVPTSRGGLITFE